MISRRVEAALIDHARQPSKRVAIGNNIHLYYSERNSEDWGAPYPVQGNSSGAGLQMYAGASMG